MTADQNRSLQRLAKWRSVFAGRWLGSRPQTDPACQSVRDLTERSLLLRAEVTALTSLLIVKGIFTDAELSAAVALECDELCKMLEREFPGYKATDTGMDIDVALAKKTSASWPP